MASFAGVALLTLACLSGTAIAQDIDGDWTPGNGWPYEEGVLEDLFSDRWPLLDQMNNTLHWDVYERFRNFTSPDNADNILTYQLANGGWLKDYDENFPNNSTDTRTTFDNDATWGESIFIAQIYRDTGDEKYHDAVLRAMEYTLAAQYPSGGWPQVYDAPISEDYWLYATINDDVQTGIVFWLDKIRQGAEPFGDDFFPEETLERIESALLLGIDFLLKAQYVREDGTLTIWGQQYDPVTLEIVEGRAYERPALTMGYESLRVIMFLMTLPQAPPIKRAVDAGLQFMMRESIILEGFVYDKSTDYKLRREEGYRLWFRFYELERDIPFFSDRDSQIYYNILQVSEERRNGYTWAANWSEALVSYVEVIDYDYTTYSLDDELRDSVVSGVTQAIVPALQDNIAAAVQEAVASLREEIESSKNAIISEVEGRECPNRVLDELNSAYSASGLTIPAVALLTNAFSNI